MFWLLASTTLLNPAHLATMALQRRRCVVCVVGFVFLPCLVAATAPKTTAQLEQQLQRQAHAHDQVVKDLETQLRQARAQAHDETVEALEKQCVILPMQRDGSRCRVRCRGWCVSHL